MSANTVNAYAVFSASHPSIPYNVADLKHASTGADAGAAKLLHYHRPAIRGTDAKCQRQLVRHDHEKCTHLPGSGVLDIFIVVGQVNSQCITYPKQSSEKTLLHGGTPTRPFTQLTYLLY